MNSDSSHRDPSRHRTQLFQSLNGLTSPEFGQLLYGLQIPAGLIPESEAPQMKRVKALLDWAEGSTGRGTDEIWDAFTQLQHKPLSPQGRDLPSFQPYLQAITTQYEQWWTHYTLTDATDTMQRPISAAPAPEPPRFFDLHLNAQLFEPRDPTKPMDSKLLGNLKQKVPRASPRGSVGWVYQN